MSAILEELTPESVAKIADQGRMRGLSVDECLKSLLPDELDEQEKALTPVVKAKL